MARNKRYHYDVRQYAVLTSKEGEVLALQLPQRFKPHGGQWTLPGGKLEPKDDPLGGLLREIEEETTFKAKVICPLYIARWDTEGSRKLAVFYHCQLKGKQRDPILSAEHQSARWCSLHAAKRMDFYNDAFKQALKRLKLDI